MPNERDRYRPQGERDDGMPEERDRGLFGYEGEGFMREGADRMSSSRFGRDREPGSRREPPGQSDLSAQRGWNIGYESDRAGRFERPSFRGRGPKNYQRADERIREDICERLTMDHDVDATDIDVQVSTGVVTLEGSVRERHAKRIAEDLAESVRGVRDVQNNLRVTR